MWNPRKSLNNYCRCYLLKCYSWHAVMKYVPLLLFQAYSKGSWSKRVAFISSSTISNSPGESRSNERYWKDTPNKVMAGKESHIKSLVIHYGPRLARWHNNSPSMASCTSWYSWYPLIMDEMENYTFAPHVHIVSLFYLKYMLVPASAHTSANRTLNKTSPGTVSFFVDRLYWNFSSTKISSPTTIG